MAIFIPEIKPEDFNNSPGEKDVYESLKKLGREYVVFYSLSWISIGNERTIGEADFVVFHPAKGILVIEVKSGEIEYKLGSWIQTNRRTGKSKEIRPYEQARKSQFEILERLQRHRDRTNNKIPMLCYAVWFPSIEYKDTDRYPTEAAQEITFDKLSLLNPEGVLEKAFDFWKNKLHFRGTNFSDIDSKSVIDELCPYFHAVPKLNTTMDDAELAYIRLTNQQTALLEFLAEQDVAVIHGLAGTGKTVLALEKAKRLASQGESVLFLCYNRYLLDSLKEHNAVPNVSIHNVNSLAYEIMGSSDTNIEDIINAFEEHLEDVFDSDMWKYKNVIVDEGQDLDDRLLNRLYDLSKGKGGCFYVFYDRNQFVLKNNLPHWIEDAECRLVLSKNCRNTVEIFSTSCNMIGLENFSLNEIHGDTPFLRFYSTESKMASIVENFMKKMKQEDVPADRITILTASALKNTFLDIGRKYAGFEISEKREPGKVLFTTIRKFKGLESDAILIVDASMISLKDDEGKRLLYVGCSRAKSYLEIAMNEDVEADDYGDYLRKINPSRLVPKNKKGLKRLLNIQIDTL